MHLIQVEKIKVPVKRVRTNFPENDHKDLMASIKSVGLLHPLVLREDGETLLAGERRLRAIKGIYADGGEIKFDQRFIPSGHVPVVGCTEQDATTYLEAELHENTRRQQLTWQEQVAAEKALHDLRLKSNPKQTKAETAREAGYSETTSGAPITESLVLAEHLDDEEIAKAPSKKEALKILTKKLERGYREGLAKQFSTLQDANGEVHNVDLRDAMPKLSEGVFACIVADPPYGVNADEFANQKAEKHAYKDDPKLSDDLYQTIAFEGYRVCARAAHLYLFCDPRRFDRIRELVEPCGWRVWPWPLIWYRGSNIGIVPWTKHGPRRTYEAILFAIKGDRPVLKIGPDVLDIQHDSSVERGAHKPPELYQELLSRSVLPGARVLDPCCGTGPIFPAAREVKAIATGFEIDPAGYAQAMERMKDPLE